MVSSWWMGPSEGLVLVAFTRLVHSHTMTVPPEHLPVVSAARKLLGRRTSSMEVRGSHIECPMRPGKAACKVSYNPGSEVPNFCHVLLVKEVTQASSDSKVKNYPAPLGGRISNGITALLTRSHIAPLRPLHTALAPTCLPCLYPLWSPDQSPCLCLLIHSSARYHNTSFFQDVGLTMPFYYLGIFSGSLVDSEVDKGKHQVPFLTGKCPAPSTGPDT